MGSKSEALPVAKTLAPARVLGGRVWLAAGLLALTCVLLYLPSLLNDFIKYYDDQHYVIDNPVVRQGLTWAGVQWAFTTNYFTNWLPITWLSHMLDVSLYGTNAGGHHFTASLLHGLSAALLLLCLVKLDAHSRSADRVNPGPARLGRCLAVAAIFALHPLRVESVSWVAERKDVLAAFFFLLTVLHYLWYAERLQQSRSLPSGTKLPIWKTPLWLYLHVCLFHALGLMSKTMVVTLPAVLLLLDVWPLRRLRVGQVGDEMADASDAQSKQSTAFSAKWIIAEKVPLLVLSIAASAWTYALQVEAMEFLQPLTLWQRLANAIVCVSLYLGKTFWPQDLAVLYPHPINWPLWQVAASAGLMVAITAFGWLVRKRSPYVLIGWFWFLGMLVPVSGIIQVGGQSMADRYSYLPSIGLIVAIVYLAADWLQKLKVPVIPAAVGVIAICSSLGVKTIWHQQVWENDLTLFAHAISVTDNNYLAETHVGTGLHEQGDDDQALAHYFRAIEINPSFANAHLNVGVIYAKRNQIDRAIAKYRDAIRLGPKQAAAYYNLGNLMVNIGRSAEAIEPLRQALELQPGWVEPRRSMGKALLQTGKSAEGYAELSQVASAEADPFKAYMILGREMINAKQPGLALEAFENAARLDPSSAMARYSMGVVLIGMNQLSAATSEFEAAVRLDPENAQARRNLAVGLASSGKVAQAVEHFEAAVRLMPQSIDARLDLAQALATVGRGQEAETICRGVLSVSPQNPRAMGILKQLGK